MRTSAIVQKSSGFGLVAAFSNLKNWWAKNLLHLRDVATLDISLETSEGSVTEEAGNLSPALFSTAHVLAPTVGTAPFRANGNPPVVLFTAISKNQYPFRTISLAPRGQKAVESPIMVSPSI